MRTGIQVTVSGAFFAKVPAEVLDKHLRGTIVDVADAGVREAKSIAAGFKRTGKYEGAIRASVSKKKLRGRAMVGARAKAYRGYIERGAVRRGKVDKFKGHHTMRRSRQAIEPRVPLFLAKHVQRIVKEMS